MRIESPVVTISFFRFAGIAKIWALQQMQLAKYPLMQLPGLQFFKLMGSGYGTGFSIRPDFSTFSLLCSWESQDAAQKAIHSSKIIQSYIRKADETWTVYMDTLACHGKWSGVVPFQAVEEEDATGVVAVITRASLHYRHIYDFWKHVPHVSKAIQGNPGLIFTKGIGEFPIVHQATFSIWTSKQEMMAFAYQNPYHTEVIRKTRALGWYKEELFARFKPVHSEGSWNGQHLLAPYLPSIASSAAL